jgi:hypothetical protein
MVLPSALAAPGRPVRLPQQAVLAAGRCGTGLRRTAPAVRHLGKLEDHVAAMPDNPDADLDQLLAQRREGQTMSSASISS